MTKGKDMSKNYAIRDGGPFVLEVAWTPVMVFDEDGPDVWNLITLMNLNIGTLVEAIFCSAEADLGGDTPYCFSQINPEGADGGLLTLSLPCEAILTGRDLAMMDLDPEIRVVRRPASMALHPVHTAAIDILMWTPDGCPPDLGPLLNRWEPTFEEIGSCSLYEHQFEFVGAAGYLPEAVYRQPRTGDVNDPEHHGHTFDPYCCGVARLRALQTTPPLTSAQRRDQAGRNDASNGA